MKLTHALAVLKHAQTLDPIGSLSGAMKAQVALHDKATAASRGRSQAGITICGNEFASWLASPKRCTPAVRSRR